MKLVWTRLALGDLDALGGYIAADSPSAAARIIDRILDLAETLRDNPAQGRAGRVPGTRELVVAGTPFIAPYRVWVDRVEILAVLHAARRWPDRFD